MRIAFTHNLQISHSEEEAEFDTPETVQAITNALRELGHEVEPLEVSGPASRVVARLEALAPDLVFNTAEGTRGRFREAFYPALFDRLGLPYTGSDAWVCALTLDKQLTKMVVASRGVPTPRWYFLEDISKLGEIDLTYPLMVKPNYEGSSMGITVDSVVENKAQLETRAVDLLSRYPSGLLVEEFIVGRDIVVPFVEKSSPATGGVLEPASYSFDAGIVGQRKYQLYDYELKTTSSMAVTVNVPADIEKAHRDEAMRLSRVVFRSLGVRDAGRIDFRLTPEGKLYFLEVNALPSLEQGASIYLSAALAGLDSQAKVVGAMVESASERFGLTPRMKPRRRSTVKVGLAFNLRRAGTAADAGGDLEAEYDTPETVAAVKKAIESYGHEVVELEATPELPSILPAAGVDVVFNMAEGTAGRFRESQVPALVELLGIPYTGSDPTTLSICLDKALAKKIVAQAGYKTPLSVVMSTGKERLPKGMTFPVIVKPVAEGSSKGILPTKNVVESEAELRELVRQTLEKYRQAVLVETYLPGREFTVALLGEKKPRVLPPMEIVFLRKNNEKHPVYSFSSKFQDVDVQGVVPAKIDDALRKDLERLARGVFVALGCRDVARVDLRCDTEGRPHFIEANPLPGLSPGFSDLCLIAEAAGMSHRALIGEILSPALRRLREKRREKMLAGRMT